MPYEAGRVLNPSFRKDLVNEVRENKVVGLQIDPPSKQENSAIPANKTTMKRSMTR